MTIDEQKTCEQRIYDHLRGRQETMEEILEACDTDSPVDGYDDPYEALNNFALAYTEWKTVKIELSWGGPADYLMALVDHENDNKIVRLDYHFADWFDHAQKPVDRDTPLFRYAEYVIGSY